MNINLHNYESILIDYLDGNLSAIERAEVEKAKNVYRRELDWMRRMPSARGTKAKAREDNFYKVKEIAHKKLDEKTPELSI